MSTLSKIREEESEETEKAHHQEVAEEEEEKEGLKDKLQNNKPLPKKSPHNKLEHVLCEILFTYVLIFPSIDSSTDKLTSF